MEGRRVGGRGPLPARIMLVGDYPSSSDERSNQCFSGPSGIELTRILHEVKLPVSDCYLTNVLKFVPPKGDIENWIDHRKGASKEKGFHNYKDGYFYNEFVRTQLLELEQEIDKVKPQLIIACGQIALWALAGKQGMTKWRGSQLYYKNIKLLPTYNPAAVLRVWEWRAIVLMDLRRALKDLDCPIWTKPNYSFLVRPTFDQAVDSLSTIYSRLIQGPTRLSIDIETRHQHMACIGLGWSPTEAACIPLMDVTHPSGYWPRHQEVYLTHKLRDILTHPNCQGVGQNFLYDAQYFARDYGYIPRLQNDTMVMQHIAFVGLPKGLDFLSSMYCSYHEYWKDEGKTWDPKKVPEDQLWTYNCKDAVVTYEVESQLLHVLEALGLTSVYRDRMEIWPILLEMMLRGVKMNQALRTQLSKLLEGEINSRKLNLQGIIGYDMKVKSPKQVHDFLYRQLALPVQKNKKTKTPTADDEALHTLQVKEPLLIPIVKLILELRSLGVFRSTFVEAPLDIDLKMRCSFNLAGPETYRLSSSENAFDTGTNLQNVPAGTEDEEITDPTALVLPNIRKMFVPDTEEQEIFDIDLAGADAQVVAWEADDQELKDAFRSGVKIHTVNAKTIFGTNAGPDGTRMPYYKYAKIGVHATNYGARPLTIAGHLGISLKEAERFQKVWFGAHPGIKDWHHRIEHQLQTCRYVENAFGYRRYYFERVDEQLLPKALAWIPQSTVAIVTFKAMVAIRKNPNLSLVQLLLQVHDSIVGQYPFIDRATILPILAKTTRIVVPYSDPLIIPWGIKTSLISWGDCGEDEEVRNLWKIKN